MKKTVIAVLGMHRSGTSALTGAMRLAGIGVGDSKELVGANASNISGHWEQWEVIAINDAILSHFDMRWDNIGVLSDGWETSTDLEELRGRAQQWIDSMNARYDTWTFKDPRVCVTLPFWKSLIPDLQYVVSFRSAAEVAASLHSRNGMPEHYGQLLWLQHWKYLVQHVGQEQILFVRYADLLADPTKQIERILQFVSTDVKLTDEQKKKIEQFIQPSNAHYELLSTPLSEHSTEFEQQPNKREEIFERTVVEMMPEIIATAGQWWTSDHHSTASADEAGQASAETAKLQEQLNAAARALGEEKMRREEDQRKHAAEIAHFLRTQKK